jgi:hypothetical protein
MPHLSELVFERCWIRVNFIQGLDNAAGNPTLRTKTEQSKKQPTFTDPSPTPDDDRPTLKRRPDTQP